MEVDSSVNEGDAILSGLGQAFDLDGLFGFGGELKEGGEWQPEARAVAVQYVAGAVAHVPCSAADASSHRPIVEDRSAPVHLPPVPRLFPDAPKRNPAQSGTDARLFTAAELDMLPANPLDRKAQRRDAKKRAKMTREHADSTMDLDGLTLGMGGGGEEVASVRPIKKVKKDRKPAQTAKGTLPLIKVSEEAEKEMEFMAFLDHVGGGYSPAVRSWGTTANALGRQPMGKPRTAWNGMRSGRGRAPLVVLHIVQARKWPAKYGTNTLASWSTRLIAPRSARPSPQPCPPPRPWPGSQSFSHRSRILRVAVSSNPMAPFQGTHGYPASASVAPP